MSHYSTIYAIALYLPFPKGLGTKLLMLEPSQVGHRLPPLVDLTITSSSYVVYVISNMCGSVH